MISIENPTQGAAGQRCIPASLVRLVRLQLESLREHQLGGREPFGALHHGSPTRVEKTKDAAPRDCKMPYIGSGMPVRFDAAEA
jgi:hypothetical protein